MTPSQSNIIVAKAIGAKFVGLKKLGLWFRPNACGYTAEECAAGRFTLEEAKKREYLHGDYSEHVVITPFSIPNFYEDANTRREMLGKMSERQKREMVCVMFPFRQYGWTVDHPVKMLELDQPTFCAAWIKAMGLDGKDL